MQDSFTFKKYLGQAFIQLNLCLRLEEGSSSAEVEQLKEKLSSSELKNQRIVELFQKTSKVNKIIIW